MDSLAHIAGRFLLHFFCADSVHKCMFWIVDWVRRVRPRWAPDLRGWWAHIVPDLIFLFFVIGFREPFDVAVGGLLLKSYSDYLSWILGLAKAAWMDYRLAPRNFEIYNQIQKRKRRR